MLQILLPGSMCDHNSSLAGSQISNNFYPIVFNLSTRFVSLFCFALSWHSKAKFANKMEVDLAQNLLL